MSEVGPVQLLAIGFGPETQYDGPIRVELERLGGLGLIRVLDVLFASRDADTEEIVALNQQGDDLGALLGSRRDVVAILERTPPEVAVGIVLIEHLWARGLKRAILDAGGVPLAESFLDAGAIALLSAERPASPPAYLAELEQLAALKANGVLTDEEYDQRKRQILGI